MVSGKNGFTILYRMCMGQYRTRVLWNVVALQSTTHSIYAPAMPVWTSKNLAPISDDSESSSKSISRTSQLS